MLTIEYRVIRNGPNLRVAVSDDTVKTDLVEIGSLKLQHLVDTVAAELVCGLLDISGSTVLAAETGLDELSAVLLQKLKGLQVCTCGDLDELRETISDLRLGECAEEGEIEEGLDGCVVGTETILVVAVVDADLDRDGGVNEANDGGGDTDEVGVSAVGSASETIQ